MFLARLMDIHWEARLMELQMSRLRDIHWDSHLVQKMYLSYAPLVRCKVGRSLEVLKYVLLVVSQMGILMVILGENHWEEYLVQIMG